MHIEGIGNNEPKSAEQKLSPGATQPSDNDKKSGNESPDLKESTGSEKRLSADQTRDKETVPEPKDKLGEN